MSDVVSDEASGVGADVVSGWAVGVAVGASSVDVDDDS